jgi:hypothetical protein
VCVCCILCSYQHPPKMKSTLTLFEVYNPTFFFGFSFSLDKSPSVNLIKSKQKHTNIYDKQ